ncbi:MAG TPA: hypothetical protein VJ001_15305 [Rhodocyclaceae bacterium]|nr:hypothetical protein [Rhodocyclaceae bacterium]
MNDLDNLEGKIVGTLETVSDQIKTLLGGRKEWTRSLKDALGCLGREQGFEICASGYPGAQEGEWLYDMSWVVLDRDNYGSLKRLAVVVESEWAPDPQLDGDFQKLVQARADIRVWIFISANGAEVRNYIARCKKQVELFQGSISGDRYIFVGFDWAEKGVQIERFQL